MYAGGEKFSQQDAVLGGATIGRSRVKRLD